MRAIITLIVFLVVGYLGSRRFVSQTMRRYPWSGLLVTGLEFLVLGVVLGPRGAGLISHEVLADLEPVVYLTLGSIGLLVGIEATWDQVRKTSRVIFGVLAGEAFVVLLVVTPVVYVLLKFLFPGYPPGERFLAAAVLAITAAVNSPTLIALLSRTLPSRGPFTNTVKVIAALNPFIPLLLFGLVFTAIRPGFFGLEMFGSGLLWWLFVNTVALVLGFFMVLFTRERCSDNEMLLLIVGTVLVVGGVCYFLKLSSLYTGMVMGFVVGNLSRKRDQIFRELHLIEKILFVAFLILAGATLELNGWAVFVVAGAYVALRMALKVVATGSILDSRLPERTPLRRASGWVFTAQGSIALAIALDYALASESALSRLSLAVVAMAVVVNDLSAVAVTRRVLLAAGEVVPLSSRKRKNEGNAQD
jgi:Kef-type K+ transport system membrane component KefB